MDNIEQIRKLIVSSRGLPWACQLKFYGNISSKNKHFRYPVTVDYRMTLRQMIDAGRYDWENDYIENFQVKGEGTVDLWLDLIHLDKVVSTKEVEVHLEAKGLRAATLEELLVFGAFYPDVQREFLVVALGSSWVNPSGDRGVPYLSRNGSERDLSLYWDVNGWDEDCRFLAVRK